MSTSQTEKSRPVNRRLRSQLRRYLLLVCTIAACLGILVSASNPASAELMSLSPLLILGGTFVVVVVLCVVIVYPILAVRSRRLLVPELGPLAAPALIVALTAILWSADLPMAVRWHFSAHAFGDAAQQVSAGIDPRTFEGDRLGLYRIRGVEPSGDRGVTRLNDGIYFRTGPMAAHCSMGSGFANLSGPRPTTGKSHHLSGDWYWFCFTSAFNSDPIGGVH
ncbi:hypothetical protein [Nocardia anaemiae]|uniref:hypothetical protein n=1 Tax=Nocardia anaemiae TaxID=263910 RepID=UPI0007A4C7A4|nr:hypothetical protein [Nocardia anaemiae]